MYVLFRSLPLSYHSSSLFSPIFHRHSSLLLSLFFSGSPFSLPRKKNTPRFSSCNHQMKQVEVDGVACTLDIMDTAGQEEFGALRDQYMKTGQGFLIVYSITTQTSFEAVTKFRNQILRVQEDRPDIPIILVGNKKDLEEDREVQPHDGEALAEKFNCDFLEASAKTNTNVNEAFFKLVHRINKWREKHPQQAPKTGKGGKKKGRCSLF
ncbi:Ras-related protein R-Ras2 [Balamuthia mandrillaris]